MTPLDRFMDNLHAWRLGEAARSAVNSPHGDLIDIGLVLLRLLNEAGYDVTLRASKADPDAASSGERNG